MSFFEDQEEILDFFSDLPMSEENVDFFSETSSPSLFDQFRPLEQTSEALQRMPLREKLEYAKDLAKFRELQQSRGFLKGAASGLSLGGSEYIPGLKPDEEDLMVGLGDVVGSYLPITGLYNLLGKPLVKFAAKSPLAKQGLMALARMTGFGVTGAAYKGGKDLVRGEIPSPKELAKEGGIWFGIDAALQTLGKGIEFGQAVRNIAQAEGVPAKDILARLWTSTKNFLKKRRISPTKIGELEGEIIFNEAKKAEREILAREKSPETDLELMEVEEAVPEAQKLDYPAEIVGEEAQPVTKMPKPLRSVSPAEVGKKKAPRAPVVGKRQAVARSKVIDLFRKAFKDPIRLGKFRERALGIHKMWPKVTRLLRANDVETASHEIGHNLHTILYGGNAKTPKEQQANVVKALRPYLDELKPLGDYDPYTLEGFAEFTRLYVTNPEAAQELAPNFYTKFEADLDAEYPELKNALLQARDYYEDYLQGTPQSRIRAQTNYAEDANRLKETIDFVKSGGLIDRLKTQFLDDVFPAKRLVAEAFGIPLSEVENLKDERNLYRSLRLLKGAVGKADVFLLHETFRADTLEKINGSLRDILQQLPDETSYREFNDYLIARRAAEKGKQGIRTGIRKSDALHVFQELHPKYEKLAKELDYYNDTLLRYAVSSGLISPIQYAAIKKNNLLYTPFQRVLEKDTRQLVSGGGKIQAVSPIKKMKGSTRDIIAPVESIVKNTYSILLNSEKNRAGQVLAKLSGMKDVGKYVERVPTPIKLKAKISQKEALQQIEDHLRKNLGIVIEGIGDAEVESLALSLYEMFPDSFTRFGAGTYPPGENIVTVYVRGKPVYYEVSPDIFEMWQKGTSPYVADILTKILRIPARTLRAGAILNPRFIQKNFIRDTWGSWLFTKYGKSIKDPVGLFIDTLYSPLAMISHAARKSPLYIEWMKAGGGMSTMQSLDRESIMKKLEEVRKGLKPHQVVKWLRATAEISEEANRLTEFGRALQVEGNTRLGKEIAAFASRDLSIDFAKMGLQTKALNQIIPFWNATVQGGDKLLRTLANPKDRARFLPRILGFIVLPSLIFSYLNRNDDRVKEFYEEEKDFNFLTFAGDTALKIPVPFETGVIAHGLTQRMINYFFNKDPEAFEGFMGSVMSAMLPNFIPALANPFIEAWANKNFFTGGRIIPLQKEGLISKFQYKRGTSPTARLLGRAISYMLGQDTRAKAASPAVIDHFVNSWFGGLGRLMISISDASLEALGLADKIPGPNYSITEKLGFNAFTARYPRANTRSIEKFYDSYADATARKKSFSEAEKLELEKEEELEKGYRRFDRIYDYPTLKVAHDALQRAQREINNIWNDPSIDEDLKQIMVDELYLQMIEFAKAANADIRRYRLDQK